LQAKVSFPLTIKPPKAGGSVSSRISLPDGIVTTSPACGTVPGQLAGDDHGPEAIAMPVVRQSHAASGTFGRRANSRSATGVQDEVVFMLTAALFMIGFHWN
jgi:hypothetical protein